MTQLLADARRASVEDEETDLALGAISGPIVPPDEGLKWLGRTLVDRVTDEWDAVVAWTGNERVSKSTGMLRLNQAVEAAGGPPLDFHNFCYSARQMNAAYRRASPMTQVDYDEASRGALAGETFRADQVVITQLLMNAGVVGVILQMCIPDIWALAKKIRGRRAVFWIHVVSRGSRRSPAPSRAILHERDQRIPYTNDESLHLAVSRRCPEIAFEPYAKTDPFWVEYETMKRTNLVGLFDENDARLDRWEAKEFGKRRD